VRSVLYDQDDESDATSTVRQLSTPQKMQRCDRGGPLPALAIALVALVGLFAACGSLAELMAFSSAMNSNAVNHRTVPGPIRSLAGTGPAPHLVASSNSSASEFLRTICPALDQFQESALPPAPTSHLCSASTSNAAAGVRAHGKPTTNGSRPGLEHDAHLLGVGGPARHAPKKTSETLTADALMANVTCVGTRSKLSHCMKGTSLGNMMPHSEASCSSMLDTMQPEFPTASVPSIAVAVIVPNMFGHDDKHHVHVGHLAWRWADMLSSCPSNPVRGSRPVIPQRALAC
jgi:hypothetical protein